MTFKIFIAYIFLVEYIYSTKKIHDNKYKLYLIWAEKPPRSFLVFLLYNKRANLLYLYLNYIMI